MKGQTLNILVSTIVLLTAHTNTLPTLSLNTTDLASTVTGIKTGVNCWPATMRGGRFAPTRDCLQAALLLPDGSDPGPFHNGNPDDEYRLPMVKVFGSCMATVSLPEGGRDRSSWDHISYVASQMAVICAKGQFPFGQTGGVTTAGHDNSIRVTLEKATMRAGDVSAQQ